MDEHFRVAGMVRAFICILFSLPLFGTVYWVVPLPIKKFSIAFRGDRPCYLHWAAQEALLLACF